MSPLASLIRQLEAAAETARKDRSHYLRLWNAAQADAFRKAAAMARKAQAETQAE